MTEQSSEPTDDLAGVPASTAEGLSDVSEDEPDTQQRDGTSDGLDLDPDDGGTVGDGQVDAAATAPSDDAPAEDLSGR